MTQLLAVYKKYKENVTGLFVGYEFIKPSKTLAKGGSPTNPTFVFLSKDKDGRKKLVESKRRIAMSRALEVINLVEAVTIMKPVEVEDALEKQFLEWQTLKRQMAVLSLLSKKIGSRVTEIDGDLTQVTKASAGQVVQIDEATVKYSTRKVGTTPKYKELYLHAYSKATKAVKAASDKLKESMMNPSLKESLKIADPALDAFLEQMKHMSMDELGQQLSFVGKIPDKAPGFTPPQLESFSEGLWADFKAVVKKNLGKIKAGFKKALGAFKKSGKAVKELVKVANSEG